MRVTRRTQCAANVPRVHAFPGRTRDGQARRTQKPGVIFASTPARRDLRSGSGQAASRRPARRVHGPRCGSRPRARSAGDGRRRAWSGSARRRSRPPSGTARGARGDSAATCNPAPCSASRRARTRGGRGASAPTSSRSHRPAAGRSGRSVGSSASVASACSTSSSRRRTVTSAARSIHAAWKNSEPGARASGTSVCSWEPVILPSRHASPITGASAQVRSRASAASSPVRSASTKTDRAARGGASSGTGSKSATAARPRCASGAGSASSSSRPIAANTSAATSSAQVSFGSHSPATRRSVRFT